MIVRRLDAAAIVAILAVCLTAEAQAQITRSRMYPARSTATGFPLAELDLGPNRFQPDTSYRGGYWNVTDSMGFRWDIDQEGGPQDGTNDAYDGGMRLDVNGQRFRRTTSSLSADGQESLFGPAAMGNVQVLRLVRIFQKEAYARFIDVFHNPTNAAASIQVQIYTCRGGSMRYVAGPGGATIGPGTHAFATDDMSPGSGRPAMYHVVAAPKSRFMPQIQAMPSNNQIYYRFSTIEVPPGKCVALMYLEFQRRSLAEVQSLDKSLKYREVLAVVPPKLRAILLNFRAAGGLELDAIELPEPEAEDVVVLAGEETLRGSVVSAEHVLRTAFGEVKLKSADLVGLATTGNPLRPVLVVMRSGEILGGSLAGDQIVFQVGDMKLNLSVGGIRSLVFQAGPKPAAEGPAVFLQSGECLRGEVLEADIDFHTRYGRLKLPLARVASVDMSMAAETPMHAVTLRTGSVLMGVVRNPSFRVRSARLGEVTLAAAAVAKIVLCPAPESGDTAFGVRLRNGELLAARLATPALHLASEHGLFELPSDKVAEIRVDPEKWALVTVQLTSGQSLTGYLREEVLDFVAEDQKATLSLGEVQQFRAAPEAKEKP